MTVVRSQKQPPKSEVSPKDNIDEGHLDTPESMKSLPVLYKEKGDYNKAEQLLLEARRLRLGDTHPHTIESMNNLIELYEAWSKPEKAKWWRSKLSRTETAQ